MLSNNSLDDLLDSAAPQTARRTDELNRILLKVAQSAETRTRRPKRTRRYLVAGVALTGVIGLGGAAAASGIIPTWTPWRTDSGTLCSMKYTVDPVDSPLARETADSPRPVYDDPATVEANYYLAQYDFDSIDRDAAVDRFVQEKHLNLPLPHTSEDELQVVAMYDLVTDQLTAHVKDGGFDPDSIVVRLDVTCAE